jgi:O-methyltransferase
MLSWLGSLVPVSLRERLHVRWQRCRAIFLPEPYRSCLPWTMVSLARLRSLDRLVHRIDEDTIPGDVVECGTCNGGSGALLAHTACRSPLGRHTWLLDSFAGMPPAGSQDGPEAFRYTGYCRGSPDAVRAVLHRLDVPDAAACIVPGWFQDTLPTLSVSRIALLHIDADWYDSVRICLEHLYDRVSPGGFVVFDDYGYWQGCRAAWQEFRQARGLAVDVTDVDGIGAYFQKPGAAEHAEALHAALS